MRSLPGAPAALVVALATELGGCGPAGAPPATPRAADPEGEPWFEEVASARGLDFTLRSGQNERYLFPEIACGGAALFDMDGDGDLDAYLVQAGSVVDPAQSRPGNQLFANDGHGF